MFFVQPIELAALPWEGYSMYVETGREIVSSPLDLSRIVKGEEWNSLPHSRAFPQFWMPQTSLLHLRISYSRKDHSPKLKVTLGCVQARKDISTHKCSYSVCEHSLRERILVRETSPHSLYSQKHIMGTREEDRKRNSEPAITIGYSLEILPCPFRGELVYLSQTCVTSSVPKRSLGKWHHNRTWKLLLQVPDRKFFQLSPQGNGNPFPLYRS